MTPSPDSSQAGDSGSPRRSGGVTDRSLGTLDAVALGIGGMVGGGIFAVLGLSVSISGGGAPLSFLIAGAVAMLTARSYAQLSVASPSRGGTSTFLNEAFGVGVVVGGLNVLLWVSYVVMLSLYATAFASYVVALVPGSPPAILDHLVLSAIVLAVTGLNVAGAAVVGRAERWIVALKLAMLAVFVATGLAGVDPARLSPSQWAGPVGVVGGAMVIFVAYEGFELIANAAEDVRDPARTLPRSLYLSVGIVVVLYVAVAVVTVGNLSLDQIRSASDYALAEAARPALGQAGFVMVALAAALSTTSALNATLYGTARLSWSIARSGELPEVLERKVWNRPVEGLLVTAALTLVVANLLSLSRISLIGSAGFLIVFGAVNAAAARSATRRVAAAAAIAGVIGCLLALVALVVEVGARDPGSLAVLAALVVGSVGVEAAYRAVSGRRIREHLGSD